MYIKSETYQNEMEILYSDANLATFSGTVLASNVDEGDEHGKKYVVAGSLIDKDGKIVTQTGASGSETLTTIPVGIVYRTVDLTNGDQPCSLIVEGYLRADRVLDGFADKAIAAIKTALPNITFR
ncbi:hypothetical protein [Clostridium beijerinckii]|uniref:hypothetical protein n=1 Tax=Clostridium beijerinckii TaxID=1520 RepID=UPI00098CA38F|nr:hypothetical protein [Clostridium beijerinckii]MBA8935805.1 hypothetical protein [Clostridium beijerinckii]NRU40199.1 hypothetical protein [Clostridium beijerinckii]NSA96523.1 hypothetical protein [Clostridium beijerinckii]OOM53203.1 hypothetical protein CLOBI_50990 [Clostridium beijerinckii]OOM70340.1 hypothetical protein CLBEIC_20040 [Clostridium beijerinckii]